MGRHDSRGPLADHLADTARAALDRSTLDGDTVPAVFEEFESGVRDELCGVFDGGDAAPLLVGASTD